MSRALAAARAVASKDLRSEIRTRFGLTALGLFVVTAVSLVVFALADEPVQRPVAAAILWVIMFYTAMTGLARAFVSEEERGTALFLRLQTDPLGVYLGKLAVNVVFALASNLAATVLMMFFLPDLTVGNIATLLWTVVLGSVGLASVLSIVSAIVAKAGTRNPLLPVLSFPLLVPLVLPGVNATVYALGGMGLADAQADLLLMFSYSGLIVVVSSLVFEVIWTD